MRYFLPFILALAALNLALFWPGLQSFDSVLQFGEALSGTFSDHHPPLMAWWWGMLYHHVMPNAGVLMFFHAALYWSAAFLIGRELGHWKTSAAYGCALLWFVAPVMTMTSVIWKDTGSAAAFLLAVGLLLPGLRGKRPSFVALGLAWLALFYGTALRHNALAALPPLCVMFALVYDPQRSRRLIGSVALALFISLVGASSLVNHLITDRKIQLLQQVCLVQLIGLSVYSNDALIPPSFFARHNTTREEFAKKTSFHIAFTNTHDYVTSDASEKAELCSALWQGIMRHPWDYLRYRAEFAKEFLDIGTTASYYQYERSLPNNTTLQKLAKRWIEAASPTVIFKPWLYLLMNVIAVGWAVRKNQKGVLLLSLSGLFYIAPHPLILPSADFRYAYWMMMSGLVAMLWIYAKAGRTFTKTS